MTLRLKEIDFHSKESMFHAKSLPHRNKLRCMIGGRSTDPTLFITHLKALGIAARREEKTNICGECSSYCLWDTCFSIPNEGVEKTSHAVMRAAEKTFGVACAYIEIGVSLNKNDFSFTFKENPRRLIYFNFDGIADDLIERVTGLQGYEEVRPLTHEWYQGTIALRLTLDSMSILDDTLEQTCAVLTEAR